MKSTMLQVLIDRLQSSGAAALTQEMKDGWVARIEERRKALQAAVESHGPAESAATVAHFAYRNAVRSAWTRLRELKRDLQNLGLKEAAIAEIIPAYNPTPHTDGPDVPVNPPKPTAKAA
jgi:hypothetical protein